MRAVLSTFLLLAAGVATGSRAAPVPAEPPLPLPTAAAPSNSPAQATSERWAGRQVVWGRRDIPLLGERETRTDTFVLAEVRRDEGGVELVQWACRVEMADVAGVSTRISAEAAQRLPPTRFRLERDDAGALRGQWSSGWDASDWDDDGQPGLTVAVSAPLCSGGVYVESRSQTRALAHEHDGAITGEVQVTVDQRVLGASSWCLGLGAKETHDRQAGGFAYVRVPDDATCTTLSPSAWPAAPRR